MLNAHTNSPGCFSSSVGTRALICTASTMAILRLLYVSGICCRRRSTTHQMRLSAASHNGMGSLSCASPWASPASFARRANGVTGLRISAVHVVCDFCKSRHAARRLSRIFRTPSTLCFTDTHQYSPSVNGRQVHATGLAQRKRRTISWKHTVVFPENEVYGACSLYWFE